MLNPLLMALVYFILVDILRASDSRNSEFFAHLVAGLFAFMLIHNAMTVGVRSVTKGGRLILNSAFPRALLPLSAVITAFMRFLPTIVVYVPDPHRLGPAGQRDDAVGAADLRADDPARLRPLDAGRRRRRSTSATSRTSCPTCCGSGSTSRRSSTTRTRCPDRYKWILEVNPLGGLLTAWSDVLNAGHAPEAGAMLLGLAWGVGLFVVAGLFFLSREREFAVRL